MTMHEQAIIKQALAEYKNHLPDGTDESHIDSVLDLFDHPF